MTPDPYTSSGRLSDPQTWNHYAYVGGDPVNRRDPSGQMYELTCGGFGDEGEGSASDYCGDINFNQNCMIEGFDSVDGAPTFDCGGDPIGQPDPTQEQTTAGFASEDTTSIKGTVSYAAQSAIWAAIPGMRNVLGSWSTTNTTCLNDLKAIGLSVGQVQQYASNGSVKFVTALNNPGVFNQMSKYDQANGTRSDFMITSNTPANTVWVNPNNFWQQNAAQLAGTIVHEFAHLNNLNATDGFFQSKLGVAASAGNTADISLKLATDCFSNIMNSVH